MTAPRRLEPPELGRSAPARHPRPATPWPGSWQPLGARYRHGADGGHGTNFALWAPGAEAVELCLFDEGGAESRHRLTEQTFQTWHGYLPGVGPGTRYGYRVHGRWDPWTGARWNPAKLLIDPYARAVDGGFTGDPACCGSVRDWPDPQTADTVRDDRDSAPYTARSVVVHDDDDWSQDRRPKTPWAETVLYELHVRGFTRRHPGVPPELRGTYAGLAHPAAIEHLVSLGVTAVELLPVHQFASEDFLRGRGLSNYWGYNSIGWFAPHGGYSSSGTRGQQVGEFKRMVRALHAAGIEVILDVVYNHTAEGGELGPTLSLRGIDNAGYYRLGRGNRGYTDYTGCGNTLDTRQPHTVRLVTDSLRYWAAEMGVDGFRFDLAAALARGSDAVDMHHPLLAAISQDPLLSRVKLIAEPWDVGAGGYQVGNFPPLWAEWNDKYRDTVRDFWRGQADGVGGLAYRLSGSSDLYQLGGRRPYASVNYVTAHDGFTLRDLVSYNGKHNEANGEQNRDGTDDNRSWNCGAEGESADPAVLELRDRQLRNLLATLLLSTGVPMLTAGDEFGRTQGGNNNAYCQDNEIGWVDWSLLEQPRWRALRDFTAALVSLRRRHPVLRQRAFFSGLAARPGQLPDLTWYTADGTEMTGVDWSGQSTVLGMRLNGGAMSERDRQGRPLTDDGFLLLLNAGPTAVEFALPPGGPYELLLDTGGASGGPLGPRTLRLLRMPQPGAPLGTENLMRSPGSAAYPPKDGRER
ncbi:glycogen debranching protein GlgX [Kitasatospora viridis]|uniref:Glycogen operon protein n=1 Tax=Kitasatospora viridis TaxID=281105 RepID=A0A561UER2_9ACTN|nr:glycogen debranching protein GlgX [Kitasatospora viridis]TWF97844.1 glycogen operon protein [Kitasatospora viridis]